MTRGDLERGYLERMLDSVDEGVLVIDRSYRILEANKAACRLAGLPKHEVVGGMCYEVAHKRSKPCSSNHKCPLEYTSREKKPLSVVHTHYDAKGNEIFVEIHASPIKDEKGNVTQIVEVLRDITERKKTEEEFRESEKRYRQLVDLSPDAIAVHSEGKIVFVNPAGAKLVGASSSSKLIGKPVIDFVHPNYRELVKKRVQQLLEEGKKVPLIEEKFLRVDGKVIDVEVAAMPIAYQGKPAVQLVFRDITERKQTEVEIKRRVKELEEFHDMAVGRELKMVELKKEIEKLKEDIRMLRGG